MEHTRYYPVIDCDSEGSVKAALFPCYSERTIRNHHRLWLEESIPDQYRLVCKVPGESRAKKDSTIRCPKCNTDMKLAVPSADSCRLGVYICPVCRKE